MKRNYYLPLTALMLISGSSLHAMKFETLGYKSISMGGASVASSTGSLATYNNPALLSKTPYKIEVSMAGGISAYDHGVGASAQELEDTGFMDTVDKLSNDINTITDADKNVLVEGKNVILDMNGESVTVAPQGYLGAQVKSFGFGVFTGSDVTATAIVSETHNQFYFESTDANGSTAYYDALAYDPNDPSNRPTVDQATYEAQSIEYAVNNNLTYLHVKGVALAEVPIAYGHNFRTNLGNIMVGGALKYMQAITYTDVLNIDDTEDSGESAKKDKRSSNFGIDLGFAYQPSFSYDLTFGLVAKNLNAPKFDFFDGTEYSVDPLVRAGVAYDIFDSLEVAADLDLTRNKTFNNEVDSQMVGGGFNYEPFKSLFALSLRGGLMYNLDTDDKSGLIYTAGLGIGVKWIQLDLSAQSSGRTSTVQGYTVPQYSKVNLALVSRW